MSDQRMIGDMRVRLSEWLTEAGDSVEVKRTWRQRLFSRPWQPWRRTFTMIPQVPMKSALLINGELMMHPQMFEQFKIAVALRPDAQTEDEK